jgi:hypothetical protein
MAVIGGLAQAQEGERSVPRPARLEDGARQDVEQGCSTLYTESGMQQWLTI